MEKGVNAIVIHPRIGMSENLEYLSESYFDTVKFIVKTASELSMKIVLYDEGMYPSGSAHGKVVAENPEYAAKGITIMSDEKYQTYKGQTDFAEKIAQLDDGKCLVYTYTQGTIRGIHYGEDDGEAGAPKAADCFLSCIIPVV